jgi:hypothetical protein
MMDEASVVKLGAVRRTRAGLHTASALFLEDEPLLHKPRNTDLVALVYLAAVFARWEVRSRERSTGMLCPWLLASVRSVLVCQGPIFGRLSPRQTPFANDPEHEYALRSLNRKAGGGGRSLGGGPPPRRHLGIETTQAGGLGQKNHHIQNTKKR